MESAKKDKSERIFNAVLILGITLFLCYVAMGFFLLKSSLNK